MKQTSKQYFSILNLLHLAMLVGQLVFLTFTVVNIAPSTTSYLSQILVINLAIAFVVTMGVSLGARAYFNAKINSIKQSPTLVSKLNQYRSALLIKYAILESGTMLTIILYWFNAHVLFLVLTGGLLIIFILHRTTKAKLIKDLALDFQEQSLLDDPEYLIQ
ncbi:MAG: hypothetical protein RL711_1772 [Bacteroidota bacterium]